MNFVRASLKYRQVTLTVLLMVFAVGLYSLLTMPRREDPKITPVQGLVIASYPGATAAQVEEQVTQKLEKYLFQYQEVLKAKTYSTTRDGLAFVTVWLKEDNPNPDVFWNKLRHQLLINKAVDLPQGVKGVIVDADFGDTEVVLLGLESDEATYSQLNDYAKKLEEQLGTLDATSKIKRLGEQKEQITVYFNSDKLSQYKIGLPQVVKVLQSQNAINPTGDINTKDNNVTFYTSGYYTNELDIKNQIVGASETGEVVRLGDIATIKREDAQQTANVNVNGHKAVMVSVQMHEGNNVVKFGKDVQKKLDEVRKQLPSNVKLTTIVNQPHIVDKNVSKFLVEFLMAIISVIIVIVLLLPFRIAAVAAMAIPMTIAVAFAVLNAFGIELHQVSLAALIVVLGMVVDDAIVVADNYVELLDHNVDRWTAAWRSAFDLIIPILTATITIIASFMPMIVLKGNIGEFIHDLPVTVTIALASSFVVAMILTPTLCFFFIKKGLHSPTETTKKKRKSLLDVMQFVYDKSIDWSVRHPFITVGGSILTIILAGVLMKTGVRERFMPYAERNQFVVELWMPTGTKLDKTKEAILRVEKLIKNDKRVTSYATFSGMSAPRVYYNFAPEMPTTNYAQILINTTTNKTTEKLAEELSTQVESLVPEGRVYVKLMEQGQPSITPVEIRILGDEINTIKSIANQVQTIVKQTEGSAFVRDDFKEDFYGIDIKLKDDASRLGFTTTSVSQYVYTGFKGYPVSTMYEGNKSIDIVLRLNEKDRQNSQDLENMYIESPVTGSSVPLRQIASLQPVWQNGNINHRNGIRCLTVHSQTSGDVLPAELLAKIQPKLAALPLPAGYKIEYGGEEEGKNEIMIQMVVAMLISLVLIFLILLIQFHNLKETAIVMFSIPLSLFGAIFGLYITGNNFGFTAFLGLISLSGIVVRNAIILIDYTNELVKQGMDVPTAAVEAGKRRLRPIFLTAMAAAIGVLPMILSGSSLWSPLASVLAFGVTWSMLTALLAVPTLYIAVIKPKDLRYKMKRPAATIILLVILFGASEVKAQQKMSINSATEMAIKNNRLLKIKQMQISEKEAKVREDKTKFLPILTLAANYQYNTNVSELTIKQASFGALPLGTMLIPLPSKDESFEMGSHNTFNASVVVYQPITQLPKINSGVEVSKTDLQITQVEQSKAMTQIKQAVEKLYYGLLILQKQKEESELKLAVAKAKLYDVESAVLSGKTIESNKIGLHASVADEQQTLLKITILIDDYSADFKRLTGISDTTTISLEPISITTTQPSIVDIKSLEQEAQTQNNELKIAMLQKTKAEHAINASRYSFLPDFGLMAGYTYQKGNALYPENNVFVGAAFKWNITEIFATNTVKSQRISMRQQAEENIINTREQLSTDIAKANRKLSQAIELISVAQKVVDYRREDLKIQADSKNSGLNIETDYLTAKAALAKAESDLYAAQLNYRIARSDLQSIVGK